MPGRLLAAAALVLGDLCQSLKAGVAAADPLGCLLPLACACRRDVASGNPLSPAVEQVRRRIRRRRRSCADPRNLLILFTLISCLGTVLFVYSRTAASLP